jgi:hypothetical protein
MFEPGEIVKVKRTSGVVESGWRVYRCPHPNDIAFMAPEVIANLAVYVGLPDDPNDPEGRGLQKVVGMGELMEWQKL